MGSSIIKNDDNDDMAMSSVDGEESEFGDEELNAFDNNFLEKYGERGTKHILSDSNIVSKSKDELEEDIIGIKRKSGPLYSEELKTQTIKDF